MNHNFTEKKFLIFKEYLSITKTIKQVFNNNDPADKITQLVSQRQACIQKIDRLNVSINKLAPPDSDELFRNDGYPARIKNIMETIACLDRELIVLTEQNHKKIKTDLLKTHHNRQAQLSYAKGSQGRYYTKEKQVSRFFDAQT